TLGSVGSYSPPRSPGRYKGAGVGPSPAYSYTACVVEAEVDPKTGWITVPKVWIAHDIGRAINPVSARGQVEGSVYMGLGEALMEEQVFRRLPPKLSNALVHKIPSLLEYKSLTSLDMPEVFTELVEDPDPNCPFGAKEVGQGPLLPVMPAVANAVYDAIGVRIDELPITPDKVLAGLEKKAKGEAPPPDSGDAGIAAADRSAEEHIQRLAHHARRGPDAERNRREREGARAVRRAMAGGGASRDRAPAQHGHARRKSVPGHALQLLQPELRVAQGERLLHEKRRRDLLGRHREQALRRDFVDRHCPRFDFPGR